MSICSAQADDSTNFKHRLSFDNGDNSIATKRQLLIMLAPESPAHNFRSFEEFQDESTYDSFHNFETDVCRDTSDDEKSISASSDDEFSLDIVEYDVPSDSEDDNAVYSTASSGTEEDYRCFVKKIKVVEYEFNQTDSDDEYILADTSSDSDGSVDPELGPADYWCCLRCKNPSNNPMYSFCEKCFQERRELFPPRPRGRRKNSKSPSVKRKPVRMSKREKCDDTVTESEGEEPMPKRAATSHSNVAGSQLNDQDDATNYRFDHASCWIIGPGSAAAWHGNT